MKDLQFLIFIADKMFFAIVCGLIIGFERKINRSPAAFKTQILICIGSMLFVSMAGFTDYLKLESGRVIAQIVSGIGFLGAGAIIRNDRGIIGLTTAAWIWFSASMGIMIGLGYGLSAIFVSSTLCAVITFARKLERCYFDNVKEIKPNSTAPQNESMPEKKSA